MKIVPEQSPSVRLLDLEKKLYDATRHMSFQDIELATGPADKLPKEYRDQKQNPHFWHVRCLHFQIEDLKATLQPSLI